MLRVFLTFLYTNRFNHERAITKVGGGGCVEVSIPRNEVSLFHNKYEPTKTNRRKELDIIGLNIIPRRPLLTKYYKVYP